MHKNNQDQTMQAYSRQRDSVGSHNHAPAQEAAAVHKGMRSSHQVSSNLLNKSSSSTANSIVQEYKTYSKNFFSKQGQNNQVQGSAMHQPQIIGGMQQNASAMAAFNNKENVEMHAQSNGSHNGRVAGSQV